LSSEETTIISTTTTTATTTTEDEKTIVQDDTTKTIQEDSILFSLDPNTSKSVCISFKIIAQNANTEGQILDQKPISSNGRIIIHEHKNVDALKFVPFSVNICQEHQSCCLAF
jgi:hypothetical protein